MHLGSIPADRQSGLGAGGAAEGPFKLVLPAEPEAWAQIACLRLQRPPPSVPAAFEGLLTGIAGRLQVLLSEVTPPKLALLAGPEAWVQIACPRLSIDWGEGFALPTLTPFEALVALGEVRLPRPICIVVQFGPGAGDADPV